MFTSRNFKALLLLSASLLFLHAGASAQSGRKPPPEPLPGTRPAPTDYTHFDKVKGDLSAPGARASLPAKACCKHAWP
jgi:hypothetical protein